MNILITGAAGFIGSHLTETLLGLGHKITGIDNFDDYYPEEFKLRNLENAQQQKNFRFIRGNVTDTSLLDALFSENTFDLVVHLAAKSGVRPSLHQAIAYFEVNVNGTLHLLEAMKRAQIHKLIYASSSSVYGNSKTFPFSETNNVDFPISPYAASKKSAELLCHSYHHLYGFDIFCMRFFTVYGPRQRPDLAIYKFTKAILNDCPVEMYGDGMTSRDYTYIDDIISGLISSIDRVKGYEIINLGESCHIALKDMISILEDALNKKALIVRKPMQEGDVNITFADIRKAQQLLGYTPKWNLKSGIREFVNWYNKTIQSGN